VIDPNAYRLWIAKLADRFNRALLPATAEEFYRVLSPVLSTEEFERAAQQIFRDEKFWPEPKMFIELGQPGRGRPQKYLPAPKQPLQGWGDCFETRGGQHVEHEAVCSCGRKYIQFELRIAFLDAISEGARQAMLREFPQGRCPTECPKCARRILASGISYPRAYHDAA
jgi:hypothetical protein